MDEPSQYIPDCTIFLLAKAYQRGHGLVQKRLRPFGLTNIQHVVLEGLWCLEGLTSMELSKLLMIDKATLSGVLERMVEAGWVVKKQDNHDKRAFRLYPSEKANKIKYQLIQERKKANDELLADFTPEERLVLRRLLLDLM